MFGLPQWMMPASAKPSSDSPAAMSPEVAKLVAEGRDIDEEAARKLLADSGIVDPLSLTPQQRASAERTRELRKTRVLPSRNDVASEAFRRVVTDFDAVSHFRQETERLRATKKFDVVSLATESDSDGVDKLIRRQRHATMLEQSTSMTAVYIQAAGFMLASATTAMMTLLAFAAAKQVHSIFLAITPLTSVAAWRAYDAYESVSEELRFLNQAKELRDVKRAHMPLAPEFNEEPTPLEAKRAARKAQQERETKRALERIGVASPQHATKPSPTPPVAPEGDDDDESMGPAILDRWKDQQARKRREQEERFQRMAASERVKNNTDKE